MVGVRRSPPRRTFAAATLVFVSVALGVSSADGTPVDTAPTLVVDSASVTAVWKEGWLRPGATVRFRGSVGAASALTAILRPVARPGTVTARRDFASVPAGSFALKMGLPPRPLPGAYSLRVLGTSGGSGLKPVGLTVRVPAPPEGVLDRALVGVKRNGPFLTYNINSPPVIRGSYKELWMRFRFLYPPTSKKVQVVWKYKWHILIGKVYARYRNTLDAYVKSKTPLVPGRWNVILTIGGRTAKQMDVLLR